MDQRHRSFREVTPEPGHAAQTKCTSTTGAGSDPQSEAEVRPGPRAPLGPGGVASDSAAKSHGGACITHSVLSPSEIGTRGGPRSRRFISVTMYLALACAESQRAGVATEALRRR